jgi:FkbM family methyltransferase
MSIRDNLRWYYGNFGLRGILAISGYRLCGRPREVTARAPGIRHPMHVRLRTTDASVYSEILRRGLYDFDLPFSPQIIVDAGANIGMASIYFANKYPKAKIIAIEAEASNFAVLARNVQPYSRITPVHAALWNRDGEICIGQPDSTTGAFGNWGFITQESQGTKVRAITMRTLMKETQIDSVDLLKMDIEGAEKEVFEACDWIGNVRCLMIELHDRYKSGCSAAVNAMCKGFSVLQRDDTTVYTRFS